MKKIFNVLLAATLVMGFASCESKLDIEKHGNMGTIEDFYKTDADAEQAAAAMYLQWRNIVADEFYVRNLMTDDFYCGGGARGDVGTMEALNEFTHGTENPYAQSMYSDYYALIYKANLLLTYLDENGSEVFKRDRAEALVARGYAHMMLGIYFGKAPVVTEILTGDKVRPYESKADGSELYAQAVADLTAAISSGKLIAKANVNDGEANNRITVDAAKAFLGKTYLFMGDNANAAKVLDEIIASGRYELLPTAEYDNLHHAVANNCKEDIFQLQKRNNNALVWAEYIGNTIELMSGWRSDKMIYAEGSQAAAERGGTASYGFMNPTKSLWDAFKAMNPAMDDARRLATLRDNNEIKTYGITFEDGYAIYGHEGYYFWKYRMLYADCMDPYGMAGYQVTQYNNMKEMRYAEVLLMAAEAHNGDAKSLEYLNMVHTRAGLPALSAYTLDALKAEKRLELVGEGCRFEDLVRWGDAASVLADNCKQCPQYTASADKVEFPDVWKKSNAGFKAGKHEHLPIPQTEIDINPNMTQQAGW